MKTKNLLFILVFALFAVGCTKETEPGTNGDDVRTISVSLAGIETRASAPVDFINTGTAGSISKVHIYVTRTDGGIIQSREVTQTGNPTDWAALTTSGGAGLKFINVGNAATKVYVYGNPAGTIVAAGGNISTVNAAVELKDQQTMNNLLYAGYDDNFTLVGTEPINPDPTVGTTYRADITMTPMVSRFQIKDVKFKTNGSEQVEKVINGTPVTSTVTWTGFTGDLVGIYMNNFYAKAQFNASLAMTGSDLMHNTTAKDNIENGKWLFGATDLVSYAAYTNYAASAYNALPLTPYTSSQKAYSFNFFPAGEITKFHFDIDNISFTTITSSDPSVFNPALNLRFINVVKYYKENTAIEMTAADFVRGKLYDFDIELIPAFLNEDLTTMQVNVIVHVTVAPWTTENLTPGFDGQ